MAARALPMPVRGMVDAYLAAVDRAAPGLIEGFYVEGSLALGNFRPHASDIDFVAVTAHAPQAADLDALAQVHAQLRAAHPRPFFDGIYVTWNDLGRDPAQAAPGPSSHESRFTARDVGQRNPITWHTLARYGIACRGPAVAECAIWQDPAALAAWTDGNLESYWRPLVARYRRLRSLQGWASFTPWACAWSVLGVARLHYTLATGDITSKEGAGRYALQTFPAQWRRVIEEALRIHRVHRAAAPRSHYWLPLLRRRDTLAFVEMVIDDAHRRYAAQDVR